MVPVLTKDGLFLYEIDQEIADQNPDRILESELIGWLFLVPNLIDILSNFGFDFCYIKLEDKIIKKSSLEIKAAYSTTYSKDKADKSPITKK